VFGCRESKDLNSTYNSTRDSGFLSNGSNSGLENGRAIGNGRITVATTTATAYPNGGINSPQNLSTAKQQVIESGLGQCVFIFVHLINYGMITCSDYVTFNYPLSNSFVTTRLGV
jgi:hypothetical protein